MWAGEVNREATSQEGRKVDQRRVDMLFPGLPPLPLLYRPLTSHSPPSFSLSATPPAHFVKTGKRATQMGCQLTQQS